MPILICPNCKSSLLPAEKTMQCQNGHSFDVSKQGYINLLLPNKKKTSDPGDNKVMINARAAFLAKGHYDVLLDSMQSLLATTEVFSTAEGSSVQLLDIGCGTGYYTRKLCTDEQISRIGIDVSKTAVAKASVADRISTYVVGSAFDLPIQSGAVELVLNIFSPVDLGELQRVLRPGGYFVKVVPVGDHMREVAELVYDTFIPHTSTIKEELEANPNFQLVKAEQVTTYIQLAGEDLLSLISMTPYLYKFGEQQLAALSELTVTISFEVILCQMEG